MKEVREIFNKLSLELVDKFFNSKKISFILREACYGYASL